MARGYPWAQCGVCDSAFVAQSVPDHVLADYYAEYYGESSPAIPDLVSQRLSEEVATFAGFRRTGRLLDVGHGAGTLLEAAAKLGWECWGTEISASAHRACTGRGWQLHVGDIVDLALPDASFDVVSMVELLEHVPHPRTQLDAAARLLRPGGLLYATTPNGRGLSARALGARWSAVAPPEHLQLFSSDGLRRAVATAGFVDANVRAQGLNPHELFAGLRGRQMAAAERVDSGYALNGRLQASSKGRAVRTMVNAALRVTSLGDSLRLRAVTPASRT